MQIPNTLASLKNRQALMLVTGGNSTLIYLIDQGFCELKDEITPEMLELYDDAETNATIDEDLKGHAKTLSRSKTSERLERSTRLIVKHAAQLEPSEVFVFCPQKMSNKLVEALQKNLNAKITVARVGNYIKSHPNDLLERIEMVIQTTNMIKHAA